MEFICQQPDLVTGVATVEKAISTKDAMPILSGILIEAQKDHLRLVATDLELGIECFIPAQTIQEGSAVVEARYLGQIVRKLDGDDVSYKSDDGHQTATIQGGRASFTIHTLDADEFPSLPEVAAESMVRVSQSVFKKMIRQTAFAASTDDSRPYLTGICLEMEKSEIRLVATDSNRLSYRKGQLIEAAESSVRVIVPARTLTEVNRILDGDEESEVQFAVADHQILFQLPEVRVISRLIEGEFPDYRQIFPTDQPMQLRIKRDVLLAAVERASLIAKKGPAIVRFAVQDGTLAITARDADVGQAYEEITVDHEGVDGETAFQAKYLTDMLKVTDTEDIRLDLSDEMRQSSMLPADSEEYIYILMPVRVG